MLLKRDGSASSVAFSGIMLALSFILMMLGSMIEVSTLFFLAAAAFCIGIVIREQGLKAGAAFLAASLLFVFFLAPNKLYGLTVIGMEAYLLAREGLWEWLDRRGRKRKEEPTLSVKSMKRRYAAGKFVIFQILFLPFVFLTPQLFLAGEITGPMRFGLIAAGDLGWLIGDLAYDVFQRQIWGRMRRQLKWNR